MGAELGATTSTFPYTPAMRDYLIATGRAPVARAADKAQASGYLERDEGAEWDDLVEIVSICIPFRSRRGLTPSFTRKGSGRT